MPGWGRGLISRGMSVVDVRGFPVGPVEAVANDRLSILTADGPVWVWFEAVFHVDETGTISLVCNRANLARYDVSQNRRAG